MYYHHSRINLKCGSTKDETKQLIYIFITSLQANSSLSAYVEAPDCCRTGVTLLHGGGRNKGSIQEAQVGDVCTLCTKSSFVRAPYVCAATLQKVTGISGM